MRVIISVWIVPGEMVFTRMPFPGQTHINCWVNKTEV